uniref:Transmembrane protein n=1 Tax=Medicago truncatula TaxID=3880 RepID=I3S2D0_MEDTR|nr:unknown [Medicago truncatula]
MLSEPDFLIPTTSFKAGTLLLLTHVLGSMLPATPTIMLFA